MSFVLNGTQQITLFESLAFLSERKQRMLDKSWAKYFSDHIFCKIDEMIFAPLYSEKTNSRPNAPINVIVGALILKELIGLTDDEIMEECEFDFRFQYALHTTSFENQPISDRTFSRFRARNAAYELITGIDLIHTCMVRLAEEIRQFMGIDPSIKRMDSMLIESNIRKMGRLELLYTCLSNLIRNIYRDGRLEIQKGYEDYVDPNNRNKVVYHEKDTPIEERLQKIIDDASQLLPECQEEYEHTEDYQLLLRAIEEQTKRDEKGNRIPKSKNDRVGTNALQNPSDPDATYHVKANKQYRGYVSNLIETVDEKGSVITDYQYDVNTRSDVSFIQEYLDNTEYSETPVTLITDSAYGSAAIEKQAEEKNITLLTTALRGRRPRKILAEFQMAEDEKTVLSCPRGNQPKSCSYMSNIDTVRVSFYRRQCENCPRQSECKPVIKDRVAVICFTLKIRKRALEDTTEQDNKLLLFIRRVRNGIETSPSMIRNKYGVDKMPIRGKLKTKHLFGFKVAALNFTKLIRFIEGKSKCRAFQSV